ncbi:MAG: hypothetical protein K1X79_00390 [Oligoflexia bacterium]|nr:hypothetical protein [Oligoflexia bacterium]
MLPLILTVVCAWFLVRPHLAQVVGGADNSQSERERLLDQKQRFVQALRDIELDFQTKKISIQEYSDMKSAASVELAGVLEQLDRISNA